MPRLLRVHFSSIGHPDARLAPLTLDLRCPAGEGASRGGDSVIWLRNGGGKSSMLNLLFSVFLPNMREFLGTTAEGKRQRFDDYVLANDLGFVITEWDLTDREAKPLFQEMPPPGRIIGRLVAWTNQQKSPDPSNLKHLFFSLRTSDEVSLETLPIHGLGEPVRSFDAFRRWLHELREAKPNLEVYYTDVQRDWRTHLTSVHLDTELFGYLVKMNRNEGDAESLFRHKTAKDFVRFFLEVAMDPAQADRVVENLGALKNQLRMRPKRLLERDFLCEIVSEFEPLAAESVQHRQAVEQLEAQRRDGAGLIAGLKHSVAELEARSVTEAGRVLESQQRQEKLQRRKAQLDRWVAWLEHRIAELRLQQATGNLDQAQRNLRQAELEVRAVEAAKCLQRVRQLGADKRALEQALQSSHQEREPLRQKLWAVGSQLVGLLEDNRNRIAQRSAEAVTAEQQAKQKREDLRADENRLQSEIGQIEARATDLRNLLERREQALKQMVEDRVVQLKELAKNAADRWQQTRQQITQRISQAEQRRKELAERIPGLQGQIHSFVKQEQAAEADYRVLDSQFQQAIQQRERLATHARICEAEEVEHVDLELPGLVARLNDLAQSTDNRLFQLRMDGAENERALTSLQNTQLLPPSHDVQVVLQELKQHGIPAHSYQEYLAQNLAADRAREQVLSDPGRFSGVGVPTESWLEQVRQVATQISDLRFPVQVSLLTLDHSGHQTAGVIVAPENDGGYNFQAAQHVRQHLEAAETERGNREEQLRASAKELAEVTHALSAYLDQYGEGRLRDLEADVAAAKLQVSDYSRQAVAAREELGQVETGRSGEQSTLDDLQRELRTAVVSYQRVEDFLRDYEHSIGDVRAELQRIERRRKEVPEEQAQIQSSLHNLDHELDQQQKRIHDARHAREAIEEEIRKIQFRDEEAPVAVSLSLEQARSEYRELQRQWNQEVGNDRLQGELDRLEKDLAEAEKECSHASEGIDAAIVEARCDAEELDLAVSNAKRIRSKCDRAVGKAQTHYDQAKQALQETGQADVEPESPVLIGDTVELGEARRLASEYCVDSETCQPKIAAERDNERRYDKLKTQFDNSANARGNHLKNLEFLIKPVAEFEPAILPDDEAELERVISGFRSQLDETQQRAGDLEQQVRRRLAAIRRIATDDRFAEHRDQIKIRLRSDDDVLASQAEQLLPRLKERYQVILQLLQDLDKDRDIVVATVHDLAMDARRLLESVEKASVLPEAFDGWAGHSFLRVRLPGIGKTPEERKTRLEPFVDRLMEEPELPGSVRLGALAVEALLGSRDYDVTLLKPQGVRRTTRHPIADLARFSEGEKLTVAVLLFCTLVRLRARNRPQSGHRGGANVLILDNPFGKCNFPEFIKLQLTLARELNVQLIYTTGVDDLGALSLFPNRVKLRNMSRHRITGHSHVTVDEEDVVTAIRLAKTDEA